MVEKEWMNDAQKALLAAAENLLIKLSQDEAYFLIRTMADNGWTFTKQAAPSISITCPQCKMTSYNPNDIKHGYCGNCHKFTGVISFDFSTQIND